MGEARRTSTLVYILVVVLSLVAFGFAVAAERRRSVVRLFSSLSQKHISCKRFSLEAHFFNVDLCFADAIAL